MKHFIHIEFEIFQSRGGKRASLSVHRRCEALSG